MAARARRSSRSRPTHRCCRPGSCAATAGAQTAANRSSLPIPEGTRPSYTEIDARKAKMRLDIRDEALKPAKSGAIPIVPGIMPITRFAQLARFSDACGAEIPRWIRRKLEGFGDDTASIRAFGLDVVTGLCERLIEGGAPGVHFYSLNQAEPTLAIWKRLISQ